MQQKDELLPTIASGERLYAVASSEPEARGDLTRIACRAERSRDGAWRLDGHKSLVIGAGVADRLLVLARTSGAAGASEGLSLFDIAADTPGARLDGYALVDGTPAGDLILENAVVPADSVVGVEGVASEGLQSAVDETIVAQCAETVGSCEDVLALCSEYLKTP